MLNFQTFKGGSASSGKSAARYYLKPDLEDPPDWVGPDHVEVRADMDPLAARGLGIDPSRVPTQEELGALIGGRRADGKKIEGKAYATGGSYLDPKDGAIKERFPLGSVDFCLTPDKSVSVAWALGTPDQRAAIHMAHRQAAGSAMVRLEEEIGRARRGGGGAGGFDAGHIGWVAFTHYTTRPTDDGWSAPNLHTHHIVPNAVFCENGRIGALHVGRLRGTIKPTGAVYHWSIGQNLHRLGLEVSIDPASGTARLPQIPDELLERFSRRGREGREKAKVWAAANGLDWDRLSDARKRGLTKSAVQISRRKKEGVADIGEWSKRAPSFRLRLKAGGGMEEEGPEVHEQRHERQGPRHGR